MKKNVKGFISLFSALAAFVCIIIAFIPTAPIAGTSLSLMGGMNLAFAGVGVLLGLVALITGIMSLRHHDQKGPRKAGMIIGIFAIIISLIACAVTAISKTFVDYANNEPGNALSQMDQSSRQAMDDALKQLRTQYPAK